MRTIWIATLMAAALAALAGAGCAVNPATGRTELMTVSEKQEVEIGREADKQVRQEQGIYAEKPELAAYVASVGRKIAAKSDRPGVQFQFAIVDSSEINAFALPGGYVFVTRGILGRMCSEDELAAVLGHEIGHVAARHGAAQMSKAQIAQVGLTGISVLSDPQYASALTGLAGVAMNLAMQGYSREDERQADELGVKYATRAGYNPLGAIDLMESFKQLETSEPSTLQKWFASHPRTSERIRNISQEVAVMKRKNPGALKRPILRDPYIDKIDGILYGEVNNSGYVSGNRYIGVKDAYSLTIPDGWTARLSGPLVTLERDSEGARAEMKIELLPRVAVSGDLAREYARKAASQGLEVLGPVTKAGLPAGEGAIVKLRAKDREGRAVIARKIFLVRFDKSYVLTFITPEEKSDELETVFQTLTGSIKYLGPLDAAKAPPPRLGLYTTLEGDTWVSIASSKVGPGASAKELAELNGREPGKPPKAGLLVKIPPAGQGR